MADFAADNPASPQPLIRGLMLVLAVALIAACVYMLLQSRSQSPLRELASSDDPNAFKVLFIGNSYTFVNELPVMLAQLCKASDPQQPLKFREVVIGGATLETHWEQSKEALAAIRGDGPWDVVVLQEQ